MKLIVLPRSGGQSLTLDTARSRDIVAMAALLLLPFLLGAVSFWFYQAQTDRVAGQQMIADWEQELARQAESVEQVHSQVGDELSAITVKVAELQARIMRLDALGEQVAQVAQLDNGEFDFTRRPAVGGPELHAASPHESAIAGTHGDGTAIQAIAGNDTAIRQASLQSLLDQLVNHLDNREQQLALLDKQLSERESRIQTFVAGRPVASGWMSSGFGKRTDPFSGNTAWHAGVDFAGKAGSDVIAVAGGVVTLSTDKSGYGQMLEINHGNGFATRYAHNERNLVAVGDVVDKGQVIARMGSTGRSTGPHVHFEVLRHGKPMNPERYIYRSSL